MSPLKSASTAKMPRYITFEIERKFAPTKTSLELLRRNSGRPAFKSSVHETKQRMEDAYYDKDNILDKHGIWVRNRSGLWEGKIRQGGDYINSQFREVQGEKEVGSLIDRFIKGAGIVNGQPHGLTEIARFATTREAWLVNDRFTISIDESDFGHTVGEVDIVETIDRGKSPYSLESEAVVGEMLDEEIRQFMRLHEWAFPDTPATGKLSAYFAWKLNKEQRLPF